MQLLIMKVLLFLGLFILIPSPGNSSGDVIVHLNSGAVRGEKMTSEQGDDFFSFREIPFAEPPVGNLRFKPPFPKKPWKDVLDGTKEAPVCLQESFFTKTVEGSEDCLYLNVFTPKIPTKNDEKKLNVFFHIHGGGFKMGTGGTAWFGPERFPVNKMVIVSPNYRLGPLGFLSTNDSASPGNYGLLDQIEALHWVRNNIHHFGGDPNKVTIVGLSAGSASVIFQMLSPLSEGLFHRAIALSGSPLCPWALQKEPLYWAKKLAKDVNCPTDTTEKMVVCLRGKPAEELIVHSNVMAGNAGMGLFNFCPTIDDIFMDTHPLKILEERKHHKNVPLFLGATKDEGNCWYHGRTNSPEDFTEEELLGALKTAVDVRPNVDKVVRRVKDKYFYTLKSYKEEDVEMILGQAITDGMFKKYILQTAKLMAESGTETYLYSYDFGTSNAVMKMFFNKDKDYGVCHGADMKALYKVTLFPEIFIEGEKEIMKTYQKLMINFIQHGNPTYTKDDDVTCEWPAVEKNTLYVYHINSKCSVDVYDETKDDLYNFWTKEIQDLYSQEITSVKQEL